MSGGNLSGCRGHSFGFIDSAWHKNPMMLGYSDRIGENIIITNAGENPTVANSPFVPIGEIWVIQSFLAKHDDGANRNVILYMRNPMSGVFAGQDPALIPNKSLNSATPFILRENDNLRAQGWGMAVGSKLTISYWGIRIDIDL